MDKSDQCIMLRKEVERLQQPQDELAYFKTRYKDLIMENSQLKDEIKVFQRNQQNNTS